MRSSIASEPHTRLRYFCSPHHQDSALYPFIAQLERAAGFAREDTPEAKLDKLEALLAPTVDVGRGRGAARRAAVAAGRRPLPAARPEPRSARRRDARGAARQLEGLARQQPVLMVFEDVHWIDPTSLELLDLHRRAGADVCRCCWSITFRPEFQPPWTGQPHVTMLTLNRLDRRDGAALVAAVAGGKALPAEIVDEIVERTDGVPLFVEELTKAVLENRPARGPRRPLRARRPAAAARDPGDAARLADGAARPARPGARRWRRSARRSAASSPTSCSRLSRRGARTELRSALDQLVDAGLSFAAAAPPQTPLHLQARAGAGRRLRDACCAHAPAAARPRSRGALENRFPETVGDAARAARPPLHRGGRDRAGDRLLAPGRRAGASSAPARSRRSRSLRRGLSCCRACPPAPARDGQSSALQVALGAALVVGRGYPAPEASQAYARARELCERTRDGRGFARCCMACRAVHFSRAEFARRESLGREMLRWVKMEATQRLRHGWPPRLGGACFRSVRFSRRANAIRRGARPLRPERHRASPSSIDRIPAYGAQLCLA